jgi:Tat protein translocase TatB subunit
MLRRRKRSRTHRGARMGNIGWSEILVIIVIVIFLFGPERLPQFIRKFRALRAAVMKLRDEAMKTVEPIEKELKQSLLDESEEKKKGKPGGFRG